MPLRSWYNCGTNHFQQADFCLAEMKKPTMLSNKRSTAWSWRRIRFLKIKSSEQDFKYLYGTISIILLWNLITCKGTQMIDCVGRFHRIVCTSQYILFFIILYSHHNICVYKRMYTLAVSLLLVRSRLQVSTVLQSIRDAKQTRCADTL